ncbi:MAG: metal-dependent hydrolase [Patescibacteria group bacterium]|nr:metal-dependent hydrolase [Patescibacteria group bacterium]
MTYKTHLSTGLLFSSIVFLLIYKIELSPALAFVLIISTVLGSSAPDLDTPTGELWHKVPGGSLISRIVHPVFIGGHRHLSHSIIGSGIFIGLFYLLVRLIHFGPLILDTKYLILAFGLGYFSHIFSDMFTEAGVPLFFPLGYHFGIPPIEKMRIKTGRWFENLVIYPVINLALILVIYSYINK